MEINAESLRVLKENEWTYTESGEIRTKPRVTYETRVRFTLRFTPEWEWGYPLPYYYTWDHSQNSEIVGDFYIEYTANKALRELPQTITIAGREWIKRGHIWREFSINGEPHTQEIWYGENWYSGTLYKDLWIDWDRGTAKEEIHISEGDGMRFRNLYSHAKEIHGPPGFFWYKEAKMHLSDYPTALAWRFVQSPVALWIQNGAERDGWKHIRAQDFGYNKWPTDEWVKIASGNGTLWTKEEKLREENGEIKITGKTHARR